MTNSIAIVILAFALGLFVYAYFGYPILLKLLGALRATARPAEAPAKWPMISITVPVYNEEAEIRGTLEGLLRIDYPADKRQILIVSDASTDRTDEIVAEFASRGVQLLRIPRRVGKTAAENAARAHMGGDIIVNTDASVRIHPNAVKPLIASFEDPSVAVASGRDLSITRSVERANAAESGYVDYEMRVRALETQLAGTVGASGCLYAIRERLHRNYIPDGLSRDFAAALNARQNGYRTVSVEEAICFVPRASSVRQEYRRKVRTVTRGLATLFFKRRLLNPFRFGLFAWMLFSHKLCRWLVPWALLLAVGALGVLSVTQPWARWALGTAVAGATLAAVGWTWPAGHQMPRMVALPAYIAGANLAVLRAWSNVFRGVQNPIWEPTRRQAIGPSVRI